MLLEEKWEFLCVDIKDWFMLLEVFLCYDVEGSILLEVIMFFNEWNVLLMVVSLKFFEDFFLLINDDFLMFCVLVDWCSDIFVCY